LACGQQVVLVPVTVVGLGQSEPRAIEQALVQAIAQVNGESIAQASSAKMQSIVESRGSSGREAILESIQSSTKGVIRDSHVNSIEVDPGSHLVKASVSARIAVFDQSEELKRQRIAIVIDDQVRSPVGESVRSKLTDLLVSTRKLAVLDRTDSRAAEAEFARIASGRMEAVEHARLSAAVAADFLAVLGPVDVTDDPEAGRMRGSARISVVEYSSGQVRYSTTVHTFVIKRGDDLIRLSNRLASELGARMIEHAFPPRVVSMDGEILTLSMGGDLMHIGDEIDLMLRGKELIDPVTHESLGWSETKLSPATLDWANSRIATARVPASAAGQIRGEIDAGKTIIVRRSSSTAGNGAAIIDGKSNAAKIGEEW
jgi:hypothetical protein